MDKSLKIANLKLGVEHSQPLSLKSINIDCSILEEEKEEPIKVPIEYHHILNLCIRNDSIMDSVNSGFGDEQILRREFPKPKYKQHLCKDNYLGEFKAETEKQLARTNLGIYSKKEIDDVLEKIIDSHNNFATIKDVKEMIANLDYVDSKLKSTVDYEIPEKLFKK